MKKKKKRLFVHTEVKRPPPKRIDRQSFYLQQFSNDECNSIVLEKQIDIYNNIKVGNFSKARTSQKYLVKSLEACFLAVKRVITNKGGKTPGIDGYVPTTREDYLELILKLHELKPDKYKASPLKRTWIKKASPSTDLRPISIPTIFDRCVQALWALALDPINEVLSDDHNYGFRKGRSPKDAMAYTRLILNSWIQPEYILEIDIKKCFDSIDHNFILKTIMVNKKILKQWLICGVMDSSQFYYDETGVSQGGIISPIICNLVLNGFQEIILEQLQNWKKEKILTSEEIKGFGICRFADDMIIMATSIRVLELAKTQLTKFLKERGLIINEKKTRISNIFDGFKFCGFYFRRFPYKNPILKSVPVTQRHGIVKTKDYIYKGKLLIFVPKEKVKSTLSKLKLIIKKSKTPKDLAFKINPIIRGFSNFYKFGNWGLTSGYMNHRLYKLIIRWLKKYYKISAAAAHKYLYDYYTFELPTETINIKQKSIKIYLPQKYPKVGAYLIKNDYKPYYNRHLYFKHLETNAQKSADSSFKRQLLKKSCNCRLCNTSLVEDNIRFDIHHKKPREFGGENKLHNYILLCVNCHQFVTGVQKSRSRQEVISLIQKNILNIPNQYLKLFFKKSDPNPTFDNTSTEDDSVINSLSIVERSWDESELNSSEDIED